MNPSTPFLRLTLTTVIMYLLAACQTSILKQEQEAEECALRFAQSYYQFELDEALNYCTEDSRPWVIWLASNISQTDIDRIFDAIYKYNKVEDSIEATFECNPDDITESLADYIKSSPINRVSMGAQSFSDDILSFIRRRHNASQIISAVERLRKADVSNISIDLMFGFPQESIQTWRTDIESALNLEIEHISAYSLMYEEGTAMTKLLLALQRRNAWRKRKGACENRETR